MSVVHENLMATQPVGKLLAKFAIPGVVALLVNSLYNIVDQIFIGHGVGFLGNGATNVIFPITVVAIGFALLIGDGAAAFLSLKLGENKLEDAHRGVGNAVTMLVAVSLGFMLVFSVFLKPLCAICGATDLLMPYALDYGRVIVLGLPLMIVGTGINSIIRADGAPAYAMKGMLVGAVINVILDPLFIFVFHWGATGAAVATVAGQAATCWLAVRYLFKCKSVRLSRPSFKLQGMISRMVLSLGVSSFINQMAIMVVIVVSNNLLVKYGAVSIYGAEIPVTVLGIVMKVAAILTAILVGVAVGSQPIVGFNYGAGNYARVRQTFKLTITVAIIISTLSFVLFFFFPQTLIGIFGSEDALYNEFAVKSFRIFLLLAVTYGFMLPAGIFLQSLGKPIKATVVSLSRQIIFFLPLVMILPRYLGVEGVLWAGAAADSLAFVMILVIIIRQMRTLAQPKTLKLSGRSGLKLVPGQTAAVGQTTA